jgi:phenylalanine-4-hydroxylase
MLKERIGNQLPADFLEDDRVLAEPVRTDEENDVWTSLLELLQEMWRRYEPSLYKDYLSGLSLLDISASRIPLLSDINAMLSRIGWSAIYVDGMVDDHLYQTMQASHIFPVARHIRRKRDMLHSAAPDFVHDVIGHLPMLFSPQYQSLLNEWARRASKARPAAQDAAASKALAALIEEREKDYPDSTAIVEKTAILQELHRQIGASPSRAAQFARFYAWAFEFGVTANDGGVIKIGGSATLSSPGEFKRIISGETRLIPFAEQAIITPVNYSVVQDTMFVADNFSEYDKVLAGI